MSNSVIVKKKTVCDYCQLDLVHGYLHSTDGHFKTVYDTFWFQ